MTIGIQRNRRLPTGLVRDTYLLNGFLGKYPVFQYVTPQRLREVELKQRIRWRLSRPEGRRPLPE